MATTGQNFVLTGGSASVLVGTGVTAPPFLGSFGPVPAATVSAYDQAAGGSGAATASNSTVVDRVVFDASLTVIPTPNIPEPVPVAYGSYIGNYAKNGAVLLVLSGTTAQTIDLTNTTTNTPASSAGDTAFSTIGCIVANNVGTHDLVLSPGGSNPAPLPVFGGTTPTITIPAGSFHVFHAATAKTVNSTNKNLTITPSAGGEIAFTFMGS